MNVGKEIRKKTKLKVSPTFVEEEISRLKELIDTDVFESEQIAKSEGMKTLQEKHLIRVYDFRIPDRNQIVNCEGCGGTFVISNNGLNIKKNGKYNTVKYKGKKMVCPFCGQKRYLKIE